MTPDRTLIVVTVVVLTGLAAAFTAIEWAARRRRPRRWPPPCDRDVPHDRITLDPGERSEWRRIWAAFTREAIAEEQARLRPGKDPS